MSNNLRLYHAMIWEPNPDILGRRASVYAESLEEAKRLLEAEYGKGTVFNLRNEEDAERPR